MRIAKKLSEKLITGLSGLGGAILFPLAFPALLVCRHFTTQEQADER